MRSRILLSAAVLCGLSIPAQAQDKTFFFKADDRIVFLGDSITEQYQYSSYMELYLTTRFPDWKLTFINAGIGGDTAGGGAGRFASHVLAEKPTAVTINFGMNDAGYGAFNPQSNANFVAKTDEMLAMAKKAGIRVGLVSPNAVDRRVQDRFKLYVETQKQYYAPLAGLAEKYGFAFADQYAMTRAELEEMEKTDPKGAKVKPYSDGFHTAPGGGLMMAHSILKGLNAPALVSSAIVTVGETATATGANCAISAATKTPTGISFTRLDKALPMPIQADWLAVLPYLNDLKDLNDYALTVKGLAEGEYTVSIDGKAISTATAKQLAEGINLGNATTGPIYDRGRKVSEAIAAKNKLVHDRFRNVVMYNVGGMPAWAGDLRKQLEERRSEELVKRMKAIEQMQADIHKLAMPVAHEFRIDKK